MDCSNSNILVACILNWVEGNPIKVFFVFKGFLVFDFDDEMFQRQDYDNVEYVFTPEMRDELTKSVNETMREIKIEKERERHRNIIKIIKIKF